MISGGYILQPRKIDESEIFRMPPVTRELWLYLLRKVNHKDNGKFKRGQGFFSLNDIQKDLEWYVGYRVERYSKPQLTKSLRRLCEGNMIETAKATRGLFITICKYCYYQHPGNYEGNGEGSTKKPRRKKGGDTKNNNDNNVINIAKQFYENQLRENPNQKYEAFIKYIFGNNPMKKRFDGMLSIRDQLSFIEFSKLLNEYGGDKIKDKLEVGENNPKYRNGRVSMYFCLNNWCKR